MGQKNRSDCVFSALKTNSCLNRLLFLTGLCTATVMFVLSQDRLNMDLDRDSLELMLGLLESDASHTSALDDCGMSSAQLHKNKQKVKELCAEIQGKGLAKHLNLENITVCFIAGSAVKSYLNLI